MLTFQYPFPLSPLPNCPSLAKTAIQFHIGSIAAAVRVSLTLFSISQTSHSMFPKRSDEPNVVDLERNLLKKNDNSEKSESTKIQAHEKKCHNNQNSSKTTAKAQSECDKLSQAKEQQHSLDQSIRWAPRKFMKNKRISKKKVARASLFLRKRETRGSMKVSRPIERSSRKWKYGCGNAIIGLKSVISLKEKRESLLSRQVLQWKVNKQESAVFGREFKYLLQ